MDGIQSLFDAIETQWGGLDILVSNAASGYNRPALEQKARGWDWTMNINARALLFCAQRRRVVDGKAGWRGDRQHFKSGLCASIAGLYRGWRQ